MEKSDVLRFGYIGGCPGCVRLQACSPGSRNHSETCRSRVGRHLEDTVERRERKSRALQRRLDQLTRELARQDELVTKNDVDFDSGAPIAPRWDCF